MEHSTKICKECTERLPDLLLDPANVPAELKAHVASCSTCGEELSALRRTFEALDAWTAPEPSPYFDTRLHARLREVQAEPAEGLWERMRSYLLFSTGRSFRPAVSAALALVLLAGGGSYLVPRFVQAGHHGSSATVNDLRVLENNAQALQQMDQLLDDNDDDTPPAS